MSALALPPVAILDPTGRRQDLNLTAAGHVALFVRAIHAPQISPMPRQRASRASMTVTATARSDIAVRRTRCPSTPL